MRRRQISSHMKNDSSCITLTVLDHHNMIEETCMMYILCDLKGHCLNLDYILYTRYPIVARAWPSGCIYVRLLYLIMLYALFHYCEHCIKMKINENCNSYYLLNLNRLF